MNVGWGFFSVVAVVVVVVVVVDGGGVGGSGGGGGVLPAVFSLSCASSHSLVSECDLFNWCSHLLEVRSEKPRLRMRRVCQSIAGILLSKPNRRA